MPARGMALVCLAIIVLGLVVVAMADVAWPMRRSRNSALSSGDIRARLSDAAILSQLGQLWPQLPCRPPLGR